MYWLDIYKADSKIYSEPWFIKISEGNTDLATISTMVDATKFSSILMKEIALRNLQKYKLKSKYI